MRPLLELREVTRSFRGLTAVDTVTFSVDQGQIVGLIGPNGAGKTTLFSVISGFLRPTKGAVFFDGQRIDSLRPDQVCHRGIVRTFQLVKPFHEMTVLENVMVGAFCRTTSRHRAEAIALEVLEFLGLSDRSRDPAGILTTPDRKRLEIARALATQPRLLLLDEMMSGLTPTEVQTMLALVRQIRQRGITIVVIEHVMRAIMSLADKIVVLHHGRLIAEGTPSEIIGNPAVLDAYLGEGLLLADGEPH
jgi:branched-chain amino acid transport system ATP-binding protein